MIPYGRQEISEEDVQEVVKVLRSDFLTQGPAVPAFEQVVAERCRAGHAVAVNSGTSALHIACLALGVGPKDRVWTSPISFTASANCARYCGASVDFVDVDARTYNMSVDALARQLAQAKSEGRLPSVVIPVHLCGQPCDMAGIHALGQRYGFKIIEDAAHAIGARYKDEPVGNGRFSDITVFSFHPVKVVTTAEGGMALTNDARLAARLRLFRNHGITREPSEMTHAPDGPWYYQQIDLGYNYRMTDVQAALGVSQMHRLETFITRRQAIARRYDAALADLPVTIPWQHPDGRSALHLYVIRLRRDRVRPTHREVFEALRASGIGVNLHYIPIYRQPYYARFAYDHARFPEAERYYGEAISIPMYAGLTEADQGRVIDALRDACAA